MASKSGSPSVEFVVIRENSAYLIGMIKQSPESVGDKLYARGFLSDESRDRVRVGVSQLSKARLIIDVVVDRTKVDRKYFYQFLEVLEAEGPWLKDVAEKLKSDLRLKCRFGILVVGLTGSGKSTLINSLLGREVAEVGHGLRSVTDSVMTYDGVIESVPVRLYDTPAVDHTSLESETCLSMIKEVIEKREIHAIVFCLQMTTFRFTRSFFQAMKSYASIGLNWGKTIFALTVADDAVERSRGSTDMAAYFDRRVESLREGIIRALNGEVGVKQTAMKFCPTDYDSEYVLPSGHKWRSLFWRSVLELSPVPVTLKENEDLAKILTE